MQAKVQSNLIKLQVNGNPIPGKQEDLKIESIVQKDKTQDINA